MTILEFFLLLAAGAVAGIGAGLLGIGGGLVLVPALSWILQSAGVPLHQAVTMAVATALAIILLSSLSSLWAHHRRGAVDWATLRLMAPWIILGAAAGSYAATVIGGAWLARLFAVFALVVAWRMWRQQQVQRYQANGLRWPRQVAFYGGMISAMLGIGGGSINVPYLTWSGLRINRAVATSAGLGYPIALAGSISFLALGWSLSLPVAHWGYIYWPGWMICSVASVALAPVGAALAHRWPGHWVARIFAGLLTIVAVRMLFNSF
ncbi:MAG: sulfite exporter TauE/SafE family protein [Wenzhouxiangellaceae bacterium]